jgi:transcriptional regulator with XRE-family HTH domain
VAVRAVQDVATEAGTHARYGGSSSRNPVATRSRRADRRVPSARTTSTPDPVRDAVLTTPGSTAPPYRLTSSRPAASSSAGGMPSRDRNPCMRAAGALRGSPASTTATVRRARARTRAADRPAAPPPTTRTSYLSLSLMADTVHPSALCTQALLPFLGRRSAMTVMDHAGVGDDGLEATLARVGPRLRQLRAQRAITLAELAARTGISKSTLSRLESGQRRPSLELLLPLTKTYGVPLDDLVGAPVGRRPARQAQAARAPRPHRRAVEPPAGRCAGLEAGHPGHRDGARAQDARGLRVAVRAVRPDARPDRRARRGPRPRRGRRVRHTRAALVRQRR